tara:strand:+ start:1426 stop:1983 length:558 start_codon:yes stop_codon:yes gene_type:complete
MTLEEIAKQSSDDKEEEQEDEEAKKSFDQSLIETLSTLTEHVKAQSESLAALDERVSKALEEKPETQLDLPNTSDDEGIGEDVKVPDTYQSNSVQAGLDDDKTDDTKKDPEDLVMQEKSEKTNFEFTTETPRPTSSIETINKSEQSELNMVLKDARTEGFDGLSVVAQRILKGDYYTPTQEEAWF